MDADRPRQKPVVLVVQDEPLLTMIMVDYAEEAGAEVVESRSAAQAVEILEGRPDIRVVFLDLDLRRSKGGMDLAHLIRGRWPPVELILTSATPLAPRPDELPARGVYLGKPFDGRAVVQTIRRLAG